VTVLSQPNDANQADVNPPTVVTPQPLHETEGQFHSMLVWKIGRFFEWLRGVEAALDDLGLSCDVHVVYSGPFTPGGPFVQVPTAIISGEVLYNGFAYKTGVSGKEKERRGIRVALQNMMTWFPDDHKRAASSIAHTLRWYSKPEAYFFPKE
jgi:hypothetical protein